MKRILYFCVGCRQVHYDNSYCKKDGDLIITDWDKFLKSVKKIREVKNGSKRSRRQ